MRAAATCTALVAAIMAVLLAGCPGRQQAPSAPGPGAKGVAGTAQPAGEPEEPTPPKAGPPETATEDEPEAERAAERRTYRGAWFAIKYPAGFGVVPREKSRTGEGYDGVSFLSPDGAVEFYVNSPQWQGEPGWIDMTPGENIVDSESEKDGSRETTRVTVEGPDGSYTRAYEDTMDTALNTRLVFGLKWRDEAALKQHHENYRKFKASLEQFAD